MKKYFLILLVSIFLWSCSHKASWDETKEINTIEAYQDFIENNPESIFISDAEFNLENLLIEKDENDWEKAQQENTKEYYQKYIDENPEGQYVEQAERGIRWINDDEIWEEYLAKNTILDYYNFRKNYPNNKNYDNAFDKIDELLKEDFDTDYREVVEFFSIVAEDQSFNTIEEYIQDNIIYIENNEEWDEGTDTTYIVDSISYNKFCAYILEELEEIYNNGGTNLTEYDEYGDYLDEYIIDYTLEYIPNGVIFNFSGECEEYSITFIYENRKLYIKEIYVYYYYCDV